MKVDIKKVEEWLKENFGDAYVIDCYGCLTEEIEVISRFNTMEVVDEHFFEML